MLKLSGFVEKGPVGKELVIRDEEMSPHSVWALETTGREEAIACSVVLSCSVGVWRCESQASRKEITSLLKKLKLKK